MAPPGGATLNMLEANYDAKKYTHGPPWYGDRNQQFRAWQEQYTTRVGDEVDDDCGLDDMYLGTDPHGLAVSAALAAGNPMPPPPGGGTAAGRRHIKRSRKAYKLLYVHVENAAIRTRFQNEARHNARLAWLILEAECVSPEDEMVTADIKLRILNSTIISVCGIVPDSLTLYQRWLIHENGKIQPAGNRLSEHDLCTLTLQQISATSAHLKVDADKELKAPAGSRVHVHPVGHPSAGQRSMNSLVDHFGALWQSQVTSGNLARRAATSTGHGGISTRVDGMSAEVTEEELQMYDGFTMEQIRERACWNCFGAGHVKDDCPSEARKRELGGHIALLTSINDRNRERGSSFGPPSSATRGPPPRSGAAPRRPFPPRRLNLKNPAAVTG